MQIQTNLNEMFSYSFYHIIITLLILIIIFIIRKNIAKKDLKQNIIIPNNKNIISIKQKYLIKLNNLLNDFNQNKISNRKSYQILSNIIRNFVFETTNIKVQNYTLKEIKLLNMPILYELVSEYYTPEFSINSKGDFKSSLEKTRMVIEKWK